MHIKHLFQNLLQLLLSHMEIHLQLQHILLLAPIHKAQILRNDLIEDKTADCGFHDSAFDGAVLHLLLHPCLDPRMQGDNSVLIGQNRLVYTLKRLALALASRTLLRQIINPQHHIL